MTSRIYPQQKDAASRLMHNDRQF
ncbi:MAG: hypothetical protein ACR5LF_12815 [Symbiopectobacterium sp.]